MDLDRLTQNSSEWLRGTGPECDVVVSTRIRLARNLAQFPFASKADAGVNVRIEKQLREVFSELNLSKPLSYIDVAALGELDRQFLLERQLISRELSESNGARGVAISKSEDVALMVNEEDHLRLQVLRSGLAFDDCWEEMDRLDDAVEAKVAYAFHETFGYLTACPTNVGTGIRVSVMMHLPALVQTREVQKVFQALQKINVAVRGLYGEGSQAMGDFYQISNQFTLGMTEAKIIDRVRDVIPMILKYERRARQEMLDGKPHELHDHISRAYGTLSNAQQMSSEETMHLLSSVRLGVNLGLIQNVGLPTLNQLFMQIQPAHLQKLKHAELNSAERNVTRASLIRSRLAEARESHGD